MNDKIIRVLYIEGFSPGPGLPDPLLNRRHFEVYTARMPYELCDIVRNPFVVLTILLLAGTIYVSTLLISWEIEWSYLWIFALFLVFMLLCIKLKRYAVGYCLDMCISTYASVLKNNRPDIVIGYSWGGGIAASMLNINAWDGPTLLIAPAGEQMFQHAARNPPTLRKGSIPTQTRVLTIQGDSDHIVALVEVRKLYLGSDEDQCELIVIRNGSHFLERAVTTNTLTEWSINLINKCERQNV